MIQTPPFHEPPKTAPGEYIRQCYCGYSSDRDMRSRCASGGLGTTLALHMLGQGAVVYGVSYGVDFRSAEYIRVTAPEQASALMSSKYIKAHFSKEILERIGRDLVSSRKVLFIGLPCDVHILKTYLEKNKIPQEGLYSVDLICHGPTDPRVAKEYIDALEKRYRSELVSINVRYKNPYSKPPYLHAVFRNGKEHLEPFYETEYGIAFYHMALPGCYQCKHKGKDHYADFTIGDYWGAKEGDPGYDPYGASVAFVYTEKGEALLKALDHFNLFPADREKALAANPRYLTSTPLTPTAEAFRKNFSKKGLFYAVRKSMTLKQRVKRLLKKMKNQEKSRKIH